MKLTGVEEQRLYELRYTNLFNQSSTHLTTDFSLTLKGLCRLWYKHERTRITLKGRWYIHKMAPTIRLNLALQTSRKEFHNIAELLKRLPTEQLPQYLTHEDVTVRQLAAIVLDHRK